MLLRRAGPQPQAGRLPVEGSRQPHAEGLDPAARSTRRTSTRFVAAEVATLQANIEAEDWDAFETNFHAMVDQANAYHEKYDKGFLRWQLPPSPPPDLDMTAT